MNRFETVPTQEKKLNLEEMEAGLDAQKDWLNDEIDSKNYKKPVGTARRLLFTAAMLLPALGVGCGAVEKPDISEKPAVSKTAESNKDDTHNYIKQRLKLERDEIKRMKESSNSFKNRSAEEKKAAEEAIEEMKKPIIDRDL